MVLLLEFWYGIAPAMRRAAAKLSLIVPGLPAKVETVWFEWYCAYSVCGDSYQVEPDAFGDGCMTYYVGFLTQREESDEEGDE